MTNRINKYVAVILIGLGFLYIQTSLLNPVPVVNTYLNMVFVLSVCLSLFLTVIQRQFFSIYFGLLLDLWFSTCSFYIISFLLVNNIVGFLSLKVTVNRFSFTLIVFVFSFILELINASILGVCSYKVPFDAFIVFQRHILGLATGNAILSFMIYPMIKERFYQKKVI